MSSAIGLKTEQDLVQLRIAGRLAADVLAMITPYVKAGVSTEALDDICNEYIVKELKVIPANVGYHGFTKTTCISPNAVVCHGIPSATDILKEGDIVNIDVAVIKDGWYGDTSRMYLVGEVSPWPGVWSRRPMRQPAPVFMLCVRVQPWVISVTPSRASLTAKVSA